MNELTVGTLLIRAANAVLWSLFIIRVMRTPRPLTTLARRVIGVVIVVGMWLLVLGALVVIGIIPGEIARTAYTAFTAGAGIAAIALLTSDEPAA